MDFIVCAPLNLFIFAFKILINNLRCTAISRNDQNASVNRIVNVCAGTDGESLTVWAPFYLTKFTLVVYFCGNFAASVIYDVDALRHERIIHAGSRGCRKRNFAAIRAPLHLVYGSVNLDFMRFMIFAGYVCDVGRPLRAVFFIHISCIWEGRIGALGVIKG